MFVLKFWGVFIFSVGEDLGVILLVYEGLVWFLVLRESFGVLFFWSVLFLCGVILREVGLSLDFELEFDYFFLFR